MYEVFFLYRDDFGNLSYQKHRGMIKRLQTAIKLARKLGNKSYVKKYMETQPTWVNLS